MNTSTLILGTLLIFALSVLVVHSRKHEVDTYLADYKAFLRLLFSVSTVKEGFSELWRALTLLPRGGRKTLDGLRIITYWFALPLILVCHTVSASVLNLLRQFVR